MRLGFRTRIELPSCITKDFKYLVVDATPYGMNDGINPLVDPYNDQQNQEKNEKKHQKRKEVISGLNKLIGQLTAILEYYNEEERKKREDDIDRFVMKNHQFFLETPWQTSQPLLWNDPMLHVNDLKRKHREEEIHDFVRARMRVE